MSGLQSMRHLPGRTRARAFVLLMALSLFASGCSLLPGLESPQAPGPIVQEPELPPRPTPDLPPPVPDEATPASDPVSPQPPPETPAAPPPASVADSREIAVILSSRIDDYDGVAVALREALGDVDVYDLSDRSLTSAEIFASMRESGSRVIVAVGHRAATLAASADEYPVVYVQVFNAGSLPTQPSRVRGVAALPPLDKQLAAWRDLNPSLSSVGAIVGPGHEDLLQEAGDAAEAHGIRFQYRLVQSDRETLYQFTRLLPEIDGFLLFPDNRVLSPSVLREMLAYASRHRIQVAVFNDSLLGLGATLSATAVDEDIARTALEVAEKLLEGDAQELPAKSPLTEIRVRTAGTPVLADGSRSPPEGGP